MSTYQSNVERARLFIEGNFTLDNASENHLEYCIRKLTMEFDAVAKAAAAPAEAEKRRAPQLRPDPLAVYRCPYCNQDGRLTDPGMCVDSYMNVCHVRCLPPAPKPSAEREAASPAIKCCCAPIHSQECPLKDARSASYRNFYPKELGQTAAQHGNEGERD